MPEAPKKKTIRIPPLFMCHFVSSISLASTTFSTTYPSLYQIRSTHILSMYVVFLIVRVWNVRSRLCVRLAAALSAFSTVGACLATFLSDAATAQSCQTSAQAAAAASAGLSSSLGVALLTTTLLVLHLLRTALWILVVATWLGSLRRILRSARIATLLTVLRLTILRLTILWLATAVVLRV